MNIDIVVSNLDAIAYYLEEGINNGGITRCALAAFLRSVARDLESATDLQQENPSLKGMSYLDALTEL